jgi:hypothetical protein
MNYGLETADAWLNALSSAWKRAGLFWLFVALDGWISSTLFGRYQGFGAVLQFGGFTYVILGPVSLWSALVAAVTWIRFVHLESAGVRSFMLLGSLIAINGWLFDRQIYTWQLVLAHLVAIVLIGLTFILSRAGCHPDPDAST